MMLRSNLLPFLLDIITAILVVGILGTGYFAFEGDQMVEKFRQYSFKEVYLIVTRDWTDLCKPHADGGLAHAGCIRLVKIASNGDGFRFSPFVFPLSAAPAYHALSYTWGPAHGVPEDEYFVSYLESTDGKILPIPKNLYRAMFRIIGLGERPFYWIDTICIDQQNTRERNEQVSAMKEIYERAEGVDVWLGPATDSEAETINRVLGDLSAMARKYGTAWTTATGYLPRGFYIPDQYALLPKEDWDTLRAFMSRRWFHRLWTLQEFALARKVRIMHGDHFINSDVLHYAALFLHTLGISMELEYGSNVTAGTAVMQQSILRACLEDMNQLREFVSQVPGVAGDEHKVPDYESILAWVFWRSATTYATDPRDLVYGILGLAEAVMGRLNNTANDTGSAISSYKPITPDYDLSTADVFRAFILRLMHSKLGIRAVALITPGVRTGNMHLSRHEYQRRRRSIPSWVDVKHELPSWIPNLANREQFSLSNGGALILNYSENAFNIHGSTTAVQTQRFHVNGNNLHVFGRRLGVSRESSMFPSDKDVGCVTFVWDLVRPLALLASKYPTRCTDKDISSIQLSPVEALLSCLSLGSSLPKNKFLFYNDWSLPAWQGERFIADGISAYLCTKLASTSDNKAIDQILTENTDNYMSYVQSIQGIDETYIYDAYKRSRMPLRIFDSRDFAGCIKAFRDETSFLQTCERLIHKFDRARGRSVFAMELDDEYARCLCTYSGVSNRKEATKMLLGLGPEMMAMKDEIWALQGSEWPFLLRPLHHDVEGKLPVMDMPFEERTGDRWNQTGKSARPIRVYELIGEVYVHGIMHGELFGHKQDLSDFEEIVIR